MEKPLTTERLHEPGEFLSEEQFNGLLNGIGNHEAKLLTTAIITSHPDLWFSESRLRTELHRIQGEPIAWRTGNKTAFSYCEDSLAPIGAVVKGSIQGPREEPITAYKSTAFGTYWGPAFTGSLLDWSLRYPDISVQKLFGTTNSNYQKRSPELNYRLYQELLTDPNTEVSYTDIVGELGKLGYDKRGTIDNQIRKLSRLGILNCRSVAQDYNPIFRIDRPDFHGYNGRRLEDIGEESRAVYATLSGLGAQGIKEISLENLIDAITDGAGRNLDRADLRDRLVKASSNSSHYFPGISVTDRKGAPIKPSDVSIRSDLVEPIQDLCNTLDSLSMIENADYSIRLARVILNDPEKCNILMQKAKRFSSGANKESVEVLGQQIASIIGHGEFSVTEIENLLVLGGRLICRGAIMNALNAMRDTGALDRRLVMENPYVRKKVAKYFSPGSDTKSKTMSD